MIDKIKLSFLFKFIEVLNSILFLKIIVNWILNIEEKKNRNLKSLTINFYNFVSEILIFKHQKRKKN